MPRTYSVVLMLLLTFASSAMGTGVPYVLLQGVDRDHGDDDIMDERVSGFTIRVSWRKLHNEGFAWLDEQMARGEQLDRDIQLRVMGGVNSPLDLPGVSYYPLEIDEGTEPELAPVPWDPQLLNQWESFVEQLGNRYADTPRLTSVHLPGFARSSEMHMTDQVMALPDYSSQALAEAWVNFADPVVEAFDDQKIVLNYATPSQAHMDHSDSDWVLDELIARAGTRAAFQANDLSARVTLDRSKYETLLQLKEQGYSVGFQMVSGSQQIRFGGEFEEAVATGLQAGAEWLEFYVNDTEYIPTAGDYNYDGIVDIADYVRWRNTLGSTIDLRADGSGNRIVDAADYDVWKSQFGASGAAAGSGGVSLVPEPSMVGLLATALVAAGAACRARWLTWRQPR
ncbi:hypothetical protein NG895_04665 [Aeoliella sp. ICT_H6.2]|uniref:PEP-CTERM protein-sorting domain-containing protein n=1 Tax=Aeoliella straminimaris TaxID=2954799 RepID=A0A9X2FBA8_9BACT|nr:hypothetical protein [Aeoliella straminimaris]MCO6043189.1 hypothetical protein [Aeoliella straminimaris]